jgi:hypothetical protein
MTTAQCWSEAISAFHTFIATVAVSALIGVILTYREVRRLRSSLSMGLQQQQPKTWRETEVWSSVENHIPSRGM